MEKLFLLFLLLHPFSVFSQLEESFDGPDITSANAWTGDLDCFAIEDGWLVSRADPDRESVSLEIPIAYAASMYWEFEVRMDVKPTTPNHIRVHVYQGNTTENGVWDYYVQIGSNKNTISLRRMTDSGNSEVLIEEVLDVLADAMTLRAKVVLDERKTWKLYVFVEEDFVLVGTIDEEVSSFCEEGSLSLECRYSKTRVDSFGFNEVIVSHVYVGETEDPESSSFSFGDVRINEVMADPSGLVDFPETEYVELYNVTDTVIDLGGWTFLYGEKEIALSACVLGAGGYVVLYRSGRDIYVDETGQALPLDKFPSALSNTGKELALWDPMGNEIDRAIYDEAEAGIAWEREKESDVFYLSTDPRGGTPGSVNSSFEEEDNDDTMDDDTSTMAVLPSEIVFNEILPNPCTGGSEYIELYNRSTRSLSLSGLSIATRKTDGTLSTYYSLSSITSSLAVAGYALLSKDLEGVEAFYQVPLSDVLHEVKLPVLANTSATLVLFRTEDETVIDEVRYSSGWHASSIKDEKGVSLERIDPDGESQDAANWTSASGLEGYGTPGYQNSQYGNIPENEPTGIEAPVYSELTNEYYIAYQLDQAGYTCRAWVFDIAGRQVCQLLNLTLMGVEGRLTWDGVSGNGSKIRAGVYVFYAELTHPQGKTKRYKQVFLIR